MKHIIIILGVFNIVILTITNIVNYNKVKTLEEISQHADSLRVLQTAMIDELANHDWNYHNCDIPCFDGDGLHFIHEQEAILDSLKTK